MGSSSPGKEKKMKLYDGQMKGKEKERINEETGERERDNRRGKEENA
jgi:hypothetical protein